MNSQTLPPVPDPQTGEPRPPRAPLDRDAHPGEPAGPEDYRSLKPPDGEGPILESYVESRSVAIGAAGFVFVLLVGFGTLRFGGFGWVTIWWLWAIILGTSLLFLLMPRVRLAAGAQWLKAGRGWVRTYELVKIKGTVAGPTIAFELTDAEDRNLYVQMVELQRNRAMWDLVYNGILHSLHDRRVEINGVAWSRLQLDDHVSSSATGQPTAGASWARERPKRLVPIWAIVTMVVLAPFGVLGIWRITQPFLSWHADGPLIGWGVTALICLALAAKGIHWWRAKRR